MSASLHNEYLEAMGIDRWVVRGADAAVDDAPVVDVPDVAAPAVHPEQQPVSGDWDSLVTQVSGCTLCGLHESRTQTVFGSGSRTADWLIIGEAPGADEDREGEPFVGGAGQLLTAMLKAIHLARKDVFITNILKCQPPEKRDPHVDELSCCHNYLQQQIRLLQPKLILAVGRIAAQNLLETTTPVGKLRGKVHRYGETGIPLVVTYHPAYLLRSPQEKRKAWDDLQLAERTAAAE